MNGRDAASAPASWRERTEWIWLVYLANLGWQPGFNPEAGLADWLFAGGVVVAFLPLWVSAFCPSASVRRIALIATTVLGFGATLVNVGASVLLVYAAAMAAQLDRRRTLRWLVGLTFMLFLLAAVSFVPFPYRLWGVLPSLVFVWVVGLSVHEDVERRRESQRLRIDHIRVEELAAAAERERIARDLHDLLGRSLTALVVRAQLVQSLAGTDPAVVAAAAAHLETDARSALQEVRGVVGGLQEICLDDELDAAGRTLRAAGIELRVIEPDTDDRPGPVVERCIALALREAVTNVVRHADARHCTVTFRRDDGAWQLEVADDGIGGVAPEGEGLRGMRERIAAIGGAVERRAGAGTTVVVAVPA